jgi:hypothetical protein
MAMKIPPKKYLASVGSNDLASRKESDLKMKMTAMMVVT